jgi:hypothetical protein
MRGETGFSSREPQRMGILPYRVRFRWIFNCSWLDFAGRSARATSNRDLRGLLKKSGTSGLRWMRSQLHGIHTVSLKPRKDMKPAGSGSFSVDS